jgi:hypothetical protein
LKLNNLMTKGAKGFGYILLGRKLRLMISKVRDFHTMKPKSAGSTTT